MDNAPAAQAPAVVEAPAATVSVQAEPEAATTPAVTDESSASPVATPISEQVEAQGDPVAIPAAPASSTTDNTPFIVGIASFIVIGGIVWMVLQFGPGVAGIRGVVRGLIRR
ncbi:outer membrane receptor protein involved in Fe transport [Arthrobacter sp. UYEF6]